MLHASNFLFWTCKFRRKHVLILSSQRVYTNIDICHFFGCPASDLLLYIQEILYLINLDGRHILLQKQKMPDTQPTQMFLQLVMGTFPTLSQSDVPTMYYKSEINNEKKEELKICSDAGSSGSVSTCFSGTAEPGDPQEQCRWDAHQGIVLSNRYNCIFSQCALGCGSCPIEPQTSLFCLPSDSETLSILSI